MDCTVETNGEKITFIEGNATLDCGSTLTACMVNTKRTVVVRNGSLTLKSNISTRDASGNQTPGQLVLVSMATDGLSDITIGTTIDRTAANVKGWMFVGTEITNIDAFLVAQ